LKYYPANSRVRFLKGFIRFRRSHKQAFPWGVITRELFIPNKEGEKDRVIYFEKDKVIVSAFVNVLKKVLRLSMPKSVIL